MIFGLTLCFFGGTYLATLAAAEAFRTTGGAALYDELKYVFAQAKVVRRAAEADDDTDENEDGIADVDQIAPHAFLQRKIVVALVALKEPQRLQTALGHLWAAYLAVLATLKMKFAQTVSIALGIADVVKVPAASLLAPAVGHVVGAKLKHWAVPAVNSLINLLAFLVAWYLQQVISAFYSGLRGARIFSTALLTLLAETVLPKVPDDFPSWMLCGINRDKFDVNDTLLDEVIGLVVFVAGFSFQLLGFFQVPFPLNIVLLPVSILEQFLRWQVTFFTDDSDVNAALQG